MPFLPLRLPLHHRGRSELLPSMLYKMFHLGGEITDCESLYGPLLAFFPNCRGNTV